MAMVDLKWFDAKGGIKEPSKDDQPYKDAELATRIIEAFAGAARVDVTIAERNVYEAALDMMRYYLTTKVLVK